MSITTLEYRVVHNNVNCGGDNFGTSDVSGHSFELFRPAEVKSVKTGPSFVGVMRLVIGFSERKDYSLEMYGARVYLDSFPQLTANSDYTS